MPIMVVCSIFFLNLYLIIVLIKKGFILDRIKQMEGQKALALVEKDLPGTCVQK